MTFPGIEITLLKSIQVFQDPGSSVVEGSELN